MHAKRPLTPELYYRLPWNLADNAITWLEPTTKCNLYCEGCYRENDPHGHKPLEEVIRDLEAGRNLRRTDGISIAGGEPLIYPHIIDLVRYVASQGWKPIINSNGQALTPTLVRELTRAGLVGFTMHVDSHQKRPGWTGKSEMELCALRLHLARMIRENSGGKVACAFNATIYRDTLDQVAPLTRWAQEHMDLVQTMVFILFRSIKAQDGHECYVHGQRINPGELVYQLDHMEAHKDIVAQEVVDQIRVLYPDFEPCSYLNGTEDPRSMKWLLTMRVGNSKGILGYLDPKFAEIVQSLHHLFYDTYVAYTRPWLTRTAQVLLPLALINKSLRKIFGRWLKNPSLWCKRMDIQSIMIIQPCDLFADGRQNMCDGCPDAIHYKGKMVWSCRVDELDKFDGFVSCAPLGGAKQLKAVAEAPAQAAPAVAEAAPVPAPEPAPAPQPAPEPTPEPAPEPIAEPVAEAPAIAPEPEKPAEPAAAPLIVREEAEVALREPAEVAVKEEAPVAVKEDAPVAVKEETPPAEPEKPAEPLAEAPAEPEPVAEAPAATPEPAPAEPVAEPVAEAPVEPAPVETPVAGAPAEPAPAAEEAVQAQAEETAKAEPEVQAAPEPVTEAPAAAPEPAPAEPVAEPAAEAPAEPAPVQETVPVEAPAPQPEPAAEEAPAKPAKSSGKSTKKAEKKKAEKTKTEKAKSDKKKAEKKKADSTKTKTAKKK